MENAAIQPKLNEIFQDVMDRDDIDITRDMTAEDVEDWDSLSHVRLIVAIEQGFGIKFANSEVDTFKCVGDLMDAIAQRTA